MGRDKKDNLFISMILAGLLMLVVLTLLIWQYYVNVIEGKDYQEFTASAEYDRHYVLIPENSDAVFWNDIYRSASEAAKQENAYLEYLGNWEAGEYDSLDYLKLAVAANVDGIILKPDGTAAMRAAIEAAEKAGIPVITVLNDDSKSARNSFVGPNTYQMGTAYGREILKCMDETTKNIIVLQHNDLSGKELIMKELKGVVLEGVSEREDIEIQEKTIVSGNAFDAEEVIWDILHDENKRPDILVCMNETDSESAYHTLIDYNLVGKVTIIGFYQTDIQLEAISKNTIPSVITVDTDQIGNACIRALEEYNDMGYVSSYYSVELDAVNAENVQNYLHMEERGKDEE